MEGIIIYKGKYGATQQYAEWLGISLHVPAVNSEHVEGGNITSCNFVILGTSVYVGKFQLRDWLKRNAGSLQNKKLYLFVVCGTPPADNDKIQLMSRMNIPEEIRNQTNIFFLPGRMEKKRLSLKDRLLIHMGAFLEKDPSMKKQMLQDFDSVKKENIIPIVNAIHSDNLRVKKSNFSRKAV